MSSTVSSLRGPPLSGRARLTRAAHLFKAITRQHHRELIPILHPILPADGVVFDVGAHAGQMAKLFALLAPQGKIYAFEPGAYALSVLRPMVRLKGRGRIAIEPIALGAAPGALTLTTPIKRSGSLGFGLSHLGQDGGEARAFRHEVRVETVDGFIRSNGITRLDLIKADIEGWEMQMLLGAEHALATLRPVVFLEVVDAYLARAGNSRAELWRFLEARDYRPHRLAPGLPVFAEQADGDVVWVPAERGGAAGGDRIEFGLGGGRSDRSWPPKSVSGHSTCGRDSAGSDAERTNAWLLTPRIAGGWQVL